MKTLLILLAAATLAGCATTSAIHSSAAIPVPPEQIYRTEQLPAEGNARVVFVRDTGLLGAASFIHVNIDGVRAASLDPGQKVELIIPPGEHVITANLFDPFGTMLPGSAEINAKAGGNYLYRIALAHGYPGPTMAIMRIMKEEAE